MTFSSPDKGSEGRKERVKITDADCHAPLPSCTAISVEQHMQQQLEQKNQQQRLRVRRVVVATDNHRLQVEDLRAAGLWREDFQHEGTQSKEQSTEEQKNERPWLIDFAGNDYLGLSQHPQVIAAAHQALDRWGVGASASQMISGYRQPQALLEQKLAQWLGVEATLIFSSGYLANVGLMMGVVGRHDLVIADKACHASLLDGIRLSGAHLKRFRHNQLDHAASLLKNAPLRQRCWLVTESIFSMTGGAAPLADLASLASEYDARLIVDEAHALGVMGVGGRGLLAELKLPQVMMTGTFGKAFGSAGAFIGGSQLLIDYLQQTARTCTYSTALPPSMTQATLTSLQLLQQQPQIVQQLRCRIDEFKRAAQRTRLPMLPSDSAIQILVVGSSERALAFSDELKSRGLWVPAIRPPTVPHGQACLRLVLSAQHSEHQMVFLFEQLQQCRSYWEDE